jgi:RNA polymerase sigma-70 factor, ECF subfamily
VGRFVDAWESADIEAMRSLLSEEAVLAMPPWADWFRGADALAEFLRLNPLRPEKRWKLVPTQAGGQPSLGGYWADSADAAGPLQAEGIIVLTLRDDGRIAEITSFRDPKIFASFGLPETIDSEGPRIYRRKR